MPAAQRATIGRIVHSHFSLPRGAGFATLPAMVTDTADGKTVDLELFGVRAEHGVGKLQRKVGFAPETDGTVPGPNTWTWPPRG